MDNIFDTSYTVIYQLCRSPARKISREILTYFSVLFYQIRFLALGLALHQHQGYDEHFVHSDWLMYSLAQAGLRDSVLFIAIGLLFLFFLIVHYQLYYSLTPKILAAIDELVLQSWPRQTGPSSLPKIKKWFYTILLQHKQIYQVARDLWQWLYQEKKTNVFNFPLQTESTQFYYLSKRNRAKIMLFWALADIFIESVFISHSIIFSVSFYLFFLPNISSSHWIVLLQLLDALLYYSVIFYLIKMLIFCGELVYMLSRAFRAEFVSLNVNFKRSCSMLLRYSIHPSISNKRLKYQALAQELLARYRHNHTRPICSLAHINIHFISPFLYEFLLGQTIFNVYIIIFAIYSELPILMLMVLVILFVLQLSIASAIFLIIVPVNEAIYGSEKAFFKLCNELKSGILSNSVSGLIVHEKVKCIFYYELTLHCRNRRALAITAGPMGIVKRKLIWEFAFIYSAFILHFSSKFIENVQLKIL